MFFLIAQQNAEINHPLLKPLKFVINFLASSCINIVLVLTKRKKHILQLEIELDCALIGISCHQKDFKLCWSINNYCGIKLKKEEDILLELKSSTSKVPFSFFTFANNEIGYELYLIENKTLGHLILPEFKIADYFLIVKGMYTDEMIHQFLNDLKKIPYILAAFKIDPEKIINKQHLYFLL